MFDDQLLDQVRSQTPGADQYVHLNNAGAALAPEQVLKAITDHLHLEARVGGYEAAALQKAELKAFHTAVAELVNAQPDNIAYASSATDAYNKALSSIPFEKGDCLLTTQDDYVSNHIAFLQLEKRSGVQLLVAPVDKKQGGVDLEAIEKMIIEHRPKLVAVTHIPTNSGLIQDVEAIGQMCRDKNIWYLVDACQSAGQLPLDVEKIGCDFLSATFRKFLRGPRGAGFLYVSDRALEAGLEPLFLDLHSAVWTGKRDYQALPTAERFELWEQPHALVLGCKAAVEIALGLGLEAIAGRVQHLARFTREQLSAIDKVQVLDQGPALGGIVTFHIPGKNPIRLKKQLLDKKINCSVTDIKSARYDFDRKGVEWALRASPHYYNTEEEIGMFVGVLGELVKR